MATPCKCQHCQQLDTSDAQAAADGVGWCSVSKQYRHAATERRCEFFNEGEKMLDDEKITGWLVEALNEADTDTLLGLRQEMSYNVSVAPNEAARVEREEELEMIEAEIDRRQAVAQ